MYYFCIAGEIKIYIYICLLPVSLDTSDVKIEKKRQFVAIGLPLQIPRLAPASRVCFVAVTVVIHFIDDADLYLIHSLFGHIT